MPELRRPRGAFRALWSLDRGDYAAHLLRLSPEDRRARFHTRTNDAALTRHAAQALAAPGQVMGWFEEGVLRGSSETRLLASGAVAEAAFAVESAFRGRGVGTELVGRALLWARNRGARRLLILTTRGNTPMLRAARRRGAAMAFDLSEVEAAIETGGPDWTSHLVEARLSEEGWLRWLHGAGRRALLAAA